jgi:hypothetical protein
MGDDEQFAAKKGKTLAFRNPRFVHGKTVELSTALEFRSSKRQVILTSSHIQFSIRIDTIVNKLFLVQEPQRQISLCNTENTENTVHMKTCDIRLALGYLS